MQTEFSLADLTKLTGVKRRSVQLWAEAAVIEAIPETERAGTGVHRRFSRQEAMIACVIAALSTFQMSIGALKGIASYVRPFFSFADGERIERAIRENLPIYLLIAGDTQRAFRATLIDPAFYFEKEKKERSLLEKIEERLLPIAKSETEYYAFALGHEMRKLEEHVTSAMITLPITGLLKAFR